MMATGMIQNIGMIHKIGRIKDMKKILLLLALICGTVYAQDTITNGESGLSVRNKLNKALKPPVATRTLSGTDKILMIKNGQTTGGDSTFTEQQQANWSLVNGSTNSVVVSASPDSSLCVKSGKLCKTPIVNEFIVGTVFNDTVYCNVLNRYYAEDTIKASITVKIKSTGKIQGAIEQIVMVGDGIHTVSFANCTIPSDSYLTINNTLNKVNWITFQWDGKRVVVTIRPQ
jgi:hypothetical protein